jgi:replicative DNA helicase
MSTAKNLLPPAGDIAQGIMDTLRTGRPHPGLPVPVGELDTHLMGFRPGDLIYLSGDRSSGKTALALSIVRTLALQAHVGGVALQSHPIGRLPRQPPPRRRVYCRHPERRPTIAH